MTILVDIGNTNTKWCTFSDQLGDIHTQPTEALVHNQFGPAAIVCSVVPDASAKLPNAYHATYDNIPGITIALDHPEQVGADRLVTALAAHARYNTDCIVIDCGTATTLCVIDKSGTYHGGLIAPGATMMADALHTTAAQLPLVPITLQPPAIGKTTIEAMQTALSRGYTHMLNGLIADLKQHYPNAQVIATGPTANTFESQLKLDHIIPTLLFDGLAKIAQNPL